MSKIIMKDLNSCRALVKGYQLFLKRNKFMQFFVQKMHYYSSYQENCTMKQPFNLLAVLKQNKIIHHYACSVLTKNILNFCG